ncbi:MAG: Rrf2 family transcriptional regulator [Halobacteriovoraceae bacterium]|nr:Rrf2 family transcriptional regulator [Halobacteriovoraceae bacterium]
MRLAGFTDYSLRVLIYLAVKRDKRCTVAEIANKYQISKNHLVKVVHNLATIGVINSYKGKGGGIALAMTPENINVGKLVQELEKDLHLVECFAISKSCTIDTSCKLKRALKLAEQQFFETLKEYTLADIVTNKSKIAADLSL